MNPPAFSVCLLPLPFVSWRIWLPPRCSCPNLSTPVTDALGAHPSMSLPPTETVPPDLSPPPVMSTECRALAPQWGAATFFFPPDPCLQQDSHKHHFAAQRLYYFPLHTEQDRPPVMAPGPLDATPPSAASLLWPHVPILRPNLLPHQGCLSAPPLRDAPRRATARPFPAFPRSGQLSPSLIACLKRPPAGHSVLPCRVSFFTAGNGALHVSLLGCCSPHQWSMSSPRATAGLAPGQGEKDALGQVT